MDMSIDREPPLVSKEEKKKGATEGC